MDANEIIDRILPEKKDVLPGILYGKDSAHYSQGYNKCREEIRKRLLNTYGKEWVGVPNVDKLEEIIIQMKWENDSGVELQAKHIAQEILKGLTNQTKGDSKWLVKK